MRVFLCGFGGFSVAIPMRSVSSLSLHAENAELDDRNTYVSLPGLFSLPPQAIRHGIVLKSADEEHDGNAGDKTILLSTEVECEIDIPDEEMFPIPKTLCNTHFYMLFSGIMFDSRPAVSGAGANPVLLLNPEQFIQKEMAK